MNVLKTTTTLGLLCFSLSTLSYAQSSQDDLHSAKERDKVAQQQASVLRTSDYVSNEKGPRKTLLQAPVNKKDALPEPKDTKNKNDN
ncbi:hypothetical protein [Gallaecimonas mangrovi]|uniref:hypothetical protein n=1 Tax=Gallaecimonas mangrovi TaxID=2291597 RepID=UPI000E2020C9|nr:hypothetical protein [Gallaecimonas mangrovi]